MKRNTDQISKGDPNEKKRNSTSTPRNPLKKQKNDEDEMKAKRQINFKSADNRSDADANERANMPVRIHPSFIP